MLYPIKPNCPTQPRITMKDIVLRNVHSTGGLLSPGILRCNATNPGTGFIFDNVHVGGTLPAAARCPSWPASSPWFLTLPTHPPLQAPTGPPTATCVRTFRARCSTPRPTRAASLRCSDGRTSTCKGGGPATLPPVVRPVHDTHLYCLVHCLCRPHLAYSPSLFKE